ncbi:hypothetical protein SRHO_G00266710 [Serrasalmus rhombeus]
MISPSLSSSLKETTDAFQIKTRAPFWPLGCWNNRSRTEPETLLGHSRSMELKLAERLAASLGLKSQTETGGVELAALRNGLIAELVTKNRTGRVFVSAGSGGVGTGPRGEAAAGRAESVCVFLKTGALSFSQESERSPPA